MKYLSCITLLLFSFSSFSASVSVMPFSFVFYAKNDSYEVDFKLKMACRYEKFIVSDSSQYEYFYEEVPLIVEQIELINGLTKFTIKNTQNRKLNLGGFFRNNKECQTIQNFFLISKKYSIGWANRFDRPIRLGLYEQSRLEQEKVFNIQKIYSKINNKELGFIYMPTGFQVNIRFGFNRVSSTGMSSYLSTTAYENKETGMPYPLLKQE